MKRKEEQQVMRWKSGHVQIKSCLLSSPESSWNGKDQSKNHNLLEEERITAPNMDGREGIGLSACERHDQKRFAAKNAQACQKRGDVRTQNALLPLANFMP